MDYQGKCIGMLGGIAQNVFNQNLVRLPSGINVSFEFFPSTTIETERVLWNAVEKLSTFNPVFVSVTYSANVNKRKFTSKISKDIMTKTGLVVAPHLTCIDTNPKILRNIAREYWRSGIRSIIALRGDHANKKCSSVTNMYASDLVLLLKKIANFDITVAAYPEVHPEAESAQSDLINLKKKFDAGASRAITQFFFDIDRYLKFRDLCVSMGIEAEIIPGIFPIFNFKQLQYFITLTKVKVPQWISIIFDGLEHDLEVQKMIGVSIAIDMVRSLIREGVKNFHFYTLNRADLTYAICTALGMKNLL